MKGRLTLLRKKTHVEFLLEVHSLVGNEYKVIGNYINAATKIEIFHVKCKTKYFVTPNSFLNGKRCPCCYKKLKTGYPDIFAKRVHDLVGNEYEIVGQYESSSKKIEMKHLVCENSYQVLPYNFLKGKRCPYCAGNKKRTHEDFVKEVYDVVGDEYTVLTKYINRRTKVWIKHDNKLCNDYTYEVTPDHFMRGVRCPKCAGLIKKTTEQFKDEVRVMVGNEYIIIGNYENARTKINIRHTVCNNKFDITPDHFLHGIRCPHCAGNAKKNTDIFKKEVFELVNTEYEVVGNYLSDDEQITMRHNICGHFYDVKPNGFLRGSRCPKCNESKGEKRIRKWLEENDLNFKPQKEFNGLIGLGGGNLSYDFYLPQQNTLIEYQGEFHDGTVGFQTEDEFKKQQEHDRRKRDYAKINNIDLLEIWYWEFDNIEVMLETKFVS